MSVYFASTLKADSEMRCGQRNEPNFQKYISSLKKAYFNLYITFTTAFNREQFI